MRRFWRELLREVKRQLNVALGYNPDGTLR